jgi:DNA-directed RNA polymerase subunit RPC12/RpoP
MLLMGANNIGRRLKTHPEVVREAKAIVRANMNKFGTTYNPKEVAFSRDNQKILFLDIETAPLRAYTWGRWKQNISLNQTISEWFMISWSAKFVNEEYVYSDVLTPKESICEDDRRICGSLWEILNEADTVVTHNGIAFDHKKINTRFLLNGFMPTKPFRIIDTLKVIKDNFSFSSNKLDNLLIQFGLPRKLHTSFELWSDCVNGVKSALLEMEEYNKNDVVTLEFAFDRLKPWIKNFPNYVLYNTIDDAMVCPTCGHKHLSDIGYYTTGVSKYKMYRCDRCSSISKLRKSEKIKVLLTNNIR